MTAEPMTLDAILHRLAAGSSEGIAAAPLMDTARNALAELGRLRRWRADAVALLDELAEHFDGEADADQPQGCDHPIPNAAMRFQMECEALAARAKL